MCRNIKRLRRPHSGESPTETELRDAALQFVRKISGYHAPSAANSDAFEAAVRDVAAAARTMFRAFRSRPRPRQPGDRAHHPAVA